MTNLYSIGDLIDKLVIENIKIFNVRQEMHKNTNLSDEEFVCLENKMNVLNQNRGTVISFLDEKLSNVMNKKEKNKFIRDIKTYYDK